MKLSNKMSFYLIIKVFVKIITSVYHRLYEYIGVFLMA